MADSNPFAVLSKNYFSRDFGGTVLGVADPYISGYHFIYFAYLPKSLKEVVQQSGSSTEKLEENDIKKILSGSCLSVTPPGARLNKIEFTGLGGIKWAVPGNIDYDTSLTIKFLEFQGTPILNIFHSWVRLIRDYRTGTPLMPNTTTYTKSAYTAVVYYMTTTPNVSPTSINYCACYDGVFPITDPMNSYASDVENQGKLEIDIEFSIDYVWTEDWVRKECERLLASEFAASKDWILIDRNVNPGTGR